MGAHMTAESHMVTSHWMHSVSPAEYKAEYEHYLQHRIESEMLEARYHESLSRLLPRSPLVPSPPVAPHWREDCAMEEESTAHEGYEPHATPLMRDSISPLMEISVSPQLPRFDLECRKRSLQPLEAMRHCSCRSRPDGPCRP